MCTHWRLRQRIGEPAELYVDLATRAELWEQRIRDLAFLDTTDKSRAVDRRL